MSTRKSDTPSSLAIASDSINPVAIVGSSFNRRERELVGPGVGPGLLMFDLNTECDDSSDDPTCAAYLDNIHRSNSLSIDGTASPTSVMGNHRVSVMSAAAFPSADNMNTASNVNGTNTANYGNNTYDASSPNFPNSGNPTTTYVASTWNALESQVSDVEANFNNKLSQAQAEAASLSSSLSTQFQPSSASEVFTGYDAGRTKRKLGSSDECIPRVPRIPCMPCSSGVAIVGTKASLQASLTAQIGDRDGAIHITPTTETTHTSYIPQPTHSSHPSQLPQLSTLPYQSSHQSTSSSSLMSTSTSTSVSCSPLNTSGESFFPNRNSSDNESMSWNGYQEEEGGQKDEYISSRRRRRLNLIVPNPRKPRTADYMCSLCTEVRRVLCDDNVMIM